MIEKSVLIVEDDIIVAKMLHQFLASNGYIVDSAINGQEALKKFNDKPAQVVITDLDMPVMDGNELISNLNYLEAPPIIFVTTVERSPELIIEIMKKGIYDYILKPVEMSDLLLKLARAFETSEMKRSLEIAQKEKVIRLENNLEWYKFEERVINRDVKSMGTNIFESLLTSFTQGAGFGTLVTLMTVMESTAKMDGGDYKIKGELFEMIRTNVRAAEKAMQTFGDMMTIVTEKHSFKKISLSDLHDRIADKAADMTDVAAVKKHHLIVSEKKHYFDGLYIEINIEYFIKAIEEVFLNSMKYSPESSNILILFIAQNDQCSIAVINENLPNEKGIKGIPMGYENLVFEPFYRLTKTVHDDYHTLDYGLGLTLVEKIVAIHGGTISINNITDYSDLKAGPKIKVDCSMTFNISSGKE